MDHIGANLSKIVHFGANLANYAIFELTKHIMPFLYKAAKYRSLLS